MPQLKTYRLFISHAWKYNEPYYSLVKLLDNAPNFDWRNHSVPEHDPIIDPNTDAGRNTLIRELRGQIQGVHCVLVIAGMYAVHRYWIEKEIEISQDFGKPIIGLIPRGQERTPRAVQDAAVEMVGWNTNSIVSAIRRHSL